MALALLGSIAFSGKAIIVKLAYRYGVDVEAGGSNPLTPTRQKDQKAQVNQALGLFCFWSS